MQERPCCRFQLFSHRRFCLRPVQERGQKHEACVRRLVAAFGFATSNARKALQAHDGLGDLQRISGCVENQKRLPTTLTSHDLFCKVLFKFGHAGTVGAHDSVEERQKAYTTLIDMRPAVQSFTSVRHCLTCVASHGNICMLERAPTQAHSRRTFALRWECRSLRPNIDPLRC